MKSLFRPILFLVILLSVFASCSRKKQDKPSFEIKIKDKKKEVNIHRYEKALFEIDTAQFESGLKQIQPDFKPFLSADLSDTANLNTLFEFVTDTQLISLYKKTMQIYPDLDQEETILSDAFTRFVYFFPDKKVPTIYTYISDMYYEMPVLIQDTVLVIALDVYLGRNFPVYAMLGLPQYRIRCMEPENIPIDVMKTIYSYELAPADRPKTLLDRMIEGGKVLTYLDAVLPEIPDSLKIGYSQRKLDWAVENEKNIWGFLVENQLLYSTDYDIQTKLIQDGPFTVGFSDDSPARLGIWVGWQIVTDFMIKNPDITLEQLINIKDSQKILLESGYKP